MLGNFNCCKCDLKQHRDSQTAKFSQLAQPWWAGFNEGRGGGRGKKGEEGGGRGVTGTEKMGGKWKGKGKGRRGRVLKFNICTKRLVDKMLGCNPDIYYERLLFIVIFL